MARGRSEWDELSPGERAKLLGRAGTPALGVSLKITEDGEICARSNHVLKGYWNQPELTSRQFLQTERYGRIYRTGDAGFWQGSELVVNGRLDRQVKVRGIRIQPEEIKHDSNVIVVLMVICLLQRAWLSPAQTNLWNLQPFLRRQKV